jgi:hypothetical protein
MPVESQGQLIRALTEEEYDRVLGTSEGFWLDFKQAPYQLDQAHERWELAKDVGAFANETGGLIVIGFRTERSPTLGIDTATAYRPVPRNLIDSVRYRSVLQTHLYPQVRGLSMYWFPPREEDSGVFVLEIPAQERQHKPFVVRRMLDEGVRETGAIGVPYRDGDQVGWWSPERVHHQLNLAHLGQGTFVPGPAEVPADRQEAAREQFDLAKGLANGDEVPICSLQAFPIQGPQQLPAFYSYEGIRGALTNPPSLRTSGFNLRTGLEPDLVDGSLVSRARGRLVAIHPSGITTGVHRADRDGLGWAINDRRPTDEPTRINSIVLVEWTLEFFRFVNLLLSPLVPKTPWRILIRAQGMRSVDVRLAPGNTTDWAAWHGPWENRRATTDDLERSLEGSGDPETDAFLALTHFYGIWGFAEEDIPYAAGGRVLSDIVAQL